MAKVAASQKANAFGWLPERMPRAAKLIADKRAEVGSEWVSECWRRGVADNLPGWLYIWDGALAVGTLWPAALEMAALGQGINAGTAGIVIKDRPVADKEAANGTA